MTDRRDAFFLTEYVQVVRESMAFFSTAIRRSLGLFLLLIVLGTAAGVAYWYSKTPYYESDLACRYVNQPMAKKVLGEMIQQLNGLAQSGSARALSRELGLPVGQAASIVAIEPRNRSGSPLYEDITEEYQPIYIFLKATDNAVFAPAQAALIRYLSGTAYQHGTAAAQRDRYTRKIGFLTADLAVVDSMVGAFTTALKNGTVDEDSSSLAHRFNIRQLLDYKTSLEEELINLERQRTLDSGESLVVIHGFVPTDRPTRGSKKVIVAFALVGLLVGTGWAVLRRAKDPAHA